MKAGNYMRMFIVISLSLVFTEACHYPNQPEDSGLAVTIIDPADGDEFMVGDLIAVTSSLTYSGGVYSLTLLVNDTIYWTISSPPTQPLVKNPTVKIAPITYEPEESGEYTFQTILETTPGEVAISNLVTVTVFDPFEIPGMVVKGTPTFTDEPATATAIEEAICWSGPGPEYKQEDILTEGQSAQLLGVKADLTWFVVEVPEADLQCWVQADHVSINIDPEELPTVEAPPILVFTPTNTQSPTKKPKPTKTEAPPPKYSSCSDYPDFSTCTNDPMGFGGCSWDTGLLQCQP